MTEKEIILVEKFLTRLSDVIGKGSEAVYKLAVKQMFINGINILFIDLCMILTGFLLYKYTRWAIRTEVAEDLPHAPIIIAGGVIWVIFAVVCLAVTPKVFTYFFNPEYAALIELINVAM
jgi:hypothetical protein